MPTGNVTFLNGSATLGSFALSGGSASFTAGNLTVNPNYTLYVEP